MENILLIIISLFALILPFLVVKVLAFFLPVSKKSKNKNLKNVYVYNFIIKENFQKLSLLQELNFFRSFFTPV
ncbi:hypothetical protein Emin_0999 [Elusimicrobium minutum Pei191]|uniref:Uncharacterized protein n=1 Tax=Elusimicrobium minutum (strain Pei191) TaxID=445932 RepID=B2KDF6_ELUMP|nr:hypothetical protein Emin_0999 [Elusimicrobium minutum Pei191]